MSPRMMPWGSDPIKPEQPESVQITYDGEKLDGVAGQSVAGILLTNGEVGFRRTTVGDRPRGVFCGIGVCFDCLVEVNGQRDVRACQRRACSGDVVVTQYDPPATAGENE